MSLIPNASSTGSNTPPDIILILENQTGTAEVIRGHQKDSQEKEIGVFVGEDFLKWRNVTDDVMKILTKDEKGNVRLVAPFATSSSGENGIVRLWSLDQEMGWMREVRMMNNTWSIGGIAWLAPRNCSGMHIAVPFPDRVSKLIPASFSDLHLPAISKNRSHTPSTRRGRFSHRIIHQ